MTQDSSPENADRINEQSRRSLGVDTLDLVQFHWWDFSDQGYVDAVKHLVRLQTEGKIGHVGVTNFDTPHLQVLLYFKLPIKANQVQYSMLDRRPESGMLELAKKHNMRLICFGTIAGGWLSDRFLGFDSETEATRAVFEASGRPRAQTISARMYKTSLDAWARGDWALFQKLLSVLRRVADRKQVELGETVTIANVAAQWVLEKLERYAAGGSLLIGIRDSGHLNETRILLTDKLRLNDKDMIEIENVLGKGYRRRDEDIWSRERGPG